MNYTMDPLSIVMAILGFFYIFLVIVKGITMYIDYRERRQITPMTPITPIN